MSSAHEQSTAPVKYRLLRELGQRSQRTYAALREDGTNTLFAVQRFARDARVDEERVSPEALTVLVRDARCLLKNWHPNIAGVRHVDLIGSAVFIATDFLDGITLEDFLVLVKTTRTGRVEHAVLARIFLDVLSGLQALHGLRDGVNTPLNVVHGELCPANIVIGRDGVARIISVFRPRPVKLSATSEALGYAAPETLTNVADRDAIEPDARIDLWAVGVMLWESLTGQRLYRDSDPARIAQRQREEEVASPEGFLADIAMKAIAFDPLLRFRSASDMTASIRAVETEVASGATVAQFVVDLAGERIRTRRTELHPGASGQRRAVQQPPVPSRPGLPRSGSLPRVSVATSTAPLPSAPESAPPSSGPRRDDALMSFSKSAPILEGAPSSRRPSKPSVSKPKLTPPPGRIRRLSGHYHLSHLGVPPQTPPPPAPAQQDDLETADRANPTGMATSAIAPAEETRPVLPESERAVGAAFDAARDVVVSPRSTPPAPGAIGSTLLAPVGALPPWKVPSAPPPPSSNRPAPPPPRVVDEHHLTAALTQPISGLTPSFHARPAQPLSVPTPSPYNERAPIASPTPSSRTRAPLERDEVTAKRRRVGFARRAVPLLIAGIAVLAIAVLLAGAALIARRGATISVAPVPTTTAEPPSTVIVAPVQVAPPTTGIPSAVKAPDEVPSAAPAPTAQ